MSFWPLEKQANSVRGITHWIECSPLHLLPRQDELVRYVLTLPAHQVWLSSGHYGHPLPPDWWNLWQPILETKPSFLYAMACAPSGQVRLRACQELAKRPTRISLGLLLVRSNDWVDLIRQTARQALQHYLTPVYASWWVDAVPLVLRFDQDVRAPFPELRQQVRTLLESPEAAAAVLQGWQSPHIPVRRGLLQLLGTTALSDEVQSLLSYDADHTIRRALIPLASPATLRYLLKDSVSSIRAAALSQLLPFLDLSLQTPEIQAALLDPRSSVRWQVQYALRQAGTDVRSFYLNLHPEKLTTREKVGWLGGLYDVGKSEDTDRVQAYMPSTELPAVRAEALRTLTRLDAARAAPWLWQALKESGQGAREAERSLIKHDLVTEQELQALWNEDNGRKRKAAIRLTRTLPRYEAAALLLEWRPVEPRLQEQIDTALVKHLGGYGKMFFSKPSLQQLQRLLASRVNGLPAQVEAALDRLAG